MASFNESFVHAVRATPAFKLWNTTTDDVIFDLVEPRYVLSSLPAPPHSGGDSEEEIEEVKADKRCIDIQCSVKHPL